LTTEPQRIPFPILIFPAFRFFPGAAADPHMAKAVTHENGGAVSAVGIGVGIGVAVAIAAGVCGKA